MRSARRLRKFRIRLEPLGTSCALSGRAGTFGAGGAGEIGGKVMMAADGFAIPVILSGCTRG